MLRIRLIIVVITIISEINGEPESTNSNHKEDNNQQSPSSDYWKNHRFNLNSLYAKYREGKSGNEPYFSEPNNNNDQ